VCLIKISVLPIFPPQLTDLRVRENVALRAAGPDAIITTMNVSAIQQELLSLPPEQQDMLSAFLVSVRLKRDGLLKVVDDRLNDTDPGNWVAWDDLKPELGDEPKDAGQ